MNGLHQSDPSEKIDEHRPDCPKCNLSMWLFAQDSDLSGAPRRMSAIYPTTKYTQAQLTVPIKKAPKAKVANKKPLNLAYAPEVRIATRAAPIFANIR